MLIWKFHQSLSCRPVLETLNYDRLHATTHQLSRCSQPRVGAAEDSRLWWCTVFLPCLSHFLVTLTHDHAQPALHQTGDRWSWNRGPHLFWKLEMEATARCKNIAVTEAEPKQRLVSVIAKVWASLLTVTLTSVLHCTKQIVWLQQWLDWYWVKGRTVYVPLL